MRPLAALAAALILLPALAAPTAGQTVFPFQVPGTDIYVQAPPDEAFTLVMRGHQFNLQSYPGVEGALILEAAVGDVVQWTVAVPPNAETHTFHLHGHPWFAPTVGRTVDTWLLHPGDAHSFTVVAGGLGHESGDWMYHCHFASHSADGMWGIFRVYPFKASLATPVSSTFALKLDRLGVPVDGAHVALAVDGVPLAARVTPLGGGEYAVSAPLPTTGVLTVTAHSDALGVSVLRVGLGGTPVPPLVADATAMMHAHA